MSKEDAPKEPSYDDYVERIHYSDKYNDDEWEYRHVILPKPMLKLLPESYFDPSEPGVLRILSVKEWREIGITQSMGWEHYEVHAPEPHILLFRREKDFLEKYQAQAQQQQAASTAAAAANGKK
ncbi:cyclin-dependent kinase regulatory subunit [Pseudozyma hubeiensis SY62]|uniref:Cyclin-dependent kinases regulatory subunit n=1 Tax=Pseudozyma hubeiensis (strain SY62) TaxID=1305764 RepID=R9P1Q0_PSEHS|nr:cyclin-dependent kinase regulatory subunit [Pseudozyma hubeiensis SY62]GAC95176.1 cyclin-dependent kinase regulatory subunit [Pseudozyma hubeiensis SY62]